MNCEHTTSCCLECNECAECAQEAPSLRARITELEATLKLWLEGYNDPMGNGDLKEKAAVAEARRLLAPTPRLGTDEGT